MWVRRALEYQRDGIDLLSAGQSPLGEVLTAPSAPLLDGIGVCLVDVADEARCERLARRDGARWAPARPRPSSAGPPGIADMPETRITDRTSSSMAAGRAWNGDDGQSGPLEIRGGALPCWTPPARRSLHP